MSNDGFFCSQYCIPSQSLGIRSSLTLITVALSYALSQQETGFWFIFHHVPTGPSVGMYSPGYSEHIPLGKFHNNRAHSNYRVSLSVLRCYGQPVHPPAPTCLEKLHSYHGSRVAFQGLQVTDHSPQVSFGGLPPLWRPALSFTASAQPKEQGMPSLQAPLLEEAGLDIGFGFVMHLWA